MNRIERVLVLPKGAKPLSAYGRNYALSGSDKVVATYLIPFPSLDPSVGCEVMLEDFNSRPCTKKEIRELDKSNADSVAAQAPAGKRRWFASREGLPFINDGGCMQVNVEYDIPSQQITATFCNGYA